MTITRPPAELAQETRATDGLSLEHVSMSYADGTQALDDVSLEVGPGELVTVVGPSGCGKTTLLNIAAGLLEATGGRLRRAGGSVGYVFQDATLLPWRTVRSNVELLCELERIPKGERRRRAVAAIERVGLCGFEDKYPRTLSNGMRMRASLARSLTLAPRVFLFDEPFAALDEITREDLNDELLALFAEERFAALFITHSISEAVFLSSRVLVLSSRPGRVVADVAVPFAYPRAPELRFEPAFTALRRTLSSALKDAYA